MKASETKRLMTIFETCHSFPIRKNYSFAFFYKCVAPFSLRLYLIITWTCNPFTFHFFLRRSFKTQEMTIIVWPLLILSMSHQEDTICAWDHRWNYFMISVYFIWNFMYVINACVCIKPGVGVYSRFPSPILPPKSVLSSNSLTPIFSLFLCKNLSL